MINYILILMVAFSLVSVWIFRFHKATPYRGGAASTMKEEFLEYGLPVGLMYAVGSLKVAAALALVVGLWIPSLVMPASALVAVLMLSALVMHVKIKDPIKKSVPAFLVLVLCVTLVVIYSKNA